MARFNCLLLAIMLAYASGEVYVTEQSPRKLSELQDRALDGTLVRLPDSAAGHIALVGFGFRRESQYPLETWMEPFGREFNDPENFRRYEVPMMGRGLVRLARGMINGGMAQGTPEALHRFVVPFYGDTRSYAREMEMDTKENHVFLYLLDREGFIRWEGRGAASEAGLEELLDTARSLAQD